MPSVACGSTGCVGCAAQHAGSAASLGDPQGLDGVVRQLHEVIARLSPQQAQVVQSALNEQIGRQARGVPERFGQAPDERMRPNTFVPATSSGLPGPCSSMGPPGQGQFFPVEQRCVLSEKWLGQPPSAETAKWTTRELEIGGFSDYVLALQSWSAMGSLEFAEEIGMAVKWPEIILQHTLNADRKSDL